jgi:hypothetical protein
MASQVLAATVIRVLSHPVIMKINFELNGLLVTGMRYHVVAQAVRSGKITCEIGTDRDPNLPAGTVIAAEYKSDPKPHFMFPREDFGTSAGSEKIKILHEATHAIFDCYADSGGTSILAIDDEAAAYLASALFLQLSDVGNRMPLFVGSAFDEACKLSNKILDATGDFIRNSRTYVVTPEASAALRHAAAIDNNLVNDGTSDKSGVLDVYNGLR